MRVPRRPPLTMNNVEKVRALIAQAVDGATEPSLARESALQAVRLIDKYKLRVSSEVQAQVRGVVRPTVNVARPRRA